MKSAEPGFHSILASLIEADERAAGQPVDIDAWTEQYPQFAEQIRSFFVNRGKLEAVLGPRGAVDGEAPTLALTNNAESGQRVRYFGDYEVLDEIARGGMGIVFKARQVSLNRVVALKMFLPAIWRDQAMSSDSMKKQKPLPISIILTSCPSTKWGNTKDNTISA